MNLALHSATVDEIVAVPLEYVGEVGNGAVNLTRMVRPPLPPQPELEQGHGRDHVTAWARMEHVIHDNPDWYLGIPQMFDSHAIPGDPPLQSPIPIAQLLALQYYQNHEGLSQPGQLGIVTVPPGESAPNSQLSQLQ